MSPRPLSFSILGYSTASLTAPRPLGAGVLRPLGLPITVQVPLTGAASLFSPRRQLQGRRGLIACWARPHPTPITYASERF